MAAKKPAGHPDQGHLANWTTTNDFLRTAKEEDVRKLLQLEKLGKSRVQYLLRIHARYNKLRADRERSELLTHSNDE